MNIFALIALLFTTAHATITEVHVHGAYQWSATHYGANSEVGRLNIVQSPLAAERTPAFTIEITQLIPYGGSVHVINPQEQGPLTPNKENNIDLKDSKPGLGHVTIPWSAICETHQCTGKSATLTLWVDNNPTLSNGGQRYMTKPVGDDQLPLQIELAPYH